MILNGNAWKLEDNISTDTIIAGKYFHLRTNLSELAKHTLEEVQPGFHEKIGKGDIIVAGKNFGCGSSREHAARVIKKVGVSAIIAESFARIFFRNAVNIGLPVVECQDTSGIAAGDELEINLEAGIINNKTKGLEFKVKPLPKIMVMLLDDGGLVAHYKKHGGFKLG